MYPFYLGIDLHFKQTYMVLMNKSGDVFSLLDIRTGFG